jgi:hypothetical protein
MPHSSAKEIHQVKKNEYNHEVAGKSTAPIKDNATHVPHTSHSQREPVNL